MNKQRRTLTDDERQRVIECIHKGWKFEVIAMEFGVGQSTVTRIAHTIKVRKNDERIARRTAIKRRVESLILHGSTPKEAAEAAGCTLKVARNVQRDMRKMAQGNVNEIKKAIKQRSSAAC